MARIKTTAEIGHIRKACEITDEIFSEIVADFTFKTEIELARFIKRSIKARGLREAFPPIVTSDSRAGNEIHPKPTSEKLEGFVILDFGVRVKGFCSDMTRTIFVGVPTNKDREVYALLLKSKTDSAKLVRPGAKCASADALARKTLGVYKKYFIHTLGHGVGRRIHERPHIFFKREDDVFEENTAITIEPGLYIPNKLGMRIEDTYLVAQKGPVALTRSSQKLFVFQALN